MRASHTRWYIPRGLQMGVVMIPLRTTAACLALLCGAAIADAGDPNPLPDPVRIDSAAFREDVLNFLRPVIAGDAVVFGDNFVIKLTSPSNAQRVEINLGLGHRYCLDHPSDCHNETAILYKQFRKELQIARALRDKREADDDSVTMIDEAGNPSTLVNRSAASLAHVPIPVSGAGAAGPIPLDDDGFSEYVRQKVQLYTTNAVTAAGSSYMLALGRPLGITVVYPSGGSETFTLTDLRSGCLIAPAKCEQAVNDFIRATARSLQDAQLDVTRLRIRLSLKATRFSKMRLGTVNRSSMMVDVAESAFGNLYEVCFQNETERLFMPSLLRIGFSPGEAMARCEANTRTALGSVGDVYGTALPADGIGMVMGSPFESARLFFVDEWSPLARALNGLLVSAPAERMIIYARDGGPAAAQALHDRARAIKSEAGENALSASVYRWTKNGWQTVVDSD
jgi:hypothetical protein